MTFFTPRGSVIQLNRVLEFPYVLEGNPILPRKSFSGSAEAGRSGGRAGVRFCKDTRPNDGAASLLTTIPEPCRSGRNMPKPALELLRVVAREPSAGAYNALGAIYGQSKRLNCAVAAFRAALRLDPASWEAHNNLALALVEQNDLSNAAREFRAVIGEKPEAFQAHNGLGLVLERLVQLDDAAREFQTAVQINPRFFYASLNL